MILDLGLSFAYINFILAECIALLALNKLGVLYAVFPFCALFEEYFFILLIFLENAPNNPSYERHNQRSPKSWPKP